MNYKCPKCKFHWSGEMEYFDKVLAHEKTHKKKDVS